MNNKLPFIKLINFRFFLFVAVSLCLGIVSAHCLLMKKVALFIIIPICFISILLLFIFLFSSKENRKKSVIFSVIFFIFAIVGFCSFSIQTSVYQNADLSNHYYKVVGKISESYPTEYGAKYLLTDVSVDGNVKGNLYYKVEVYSIGGSDYDIGDIISFEEYLIDKPIIFEGRFSSYSIESKVKYTANVEASVIEKVGYAPNIFQRVNLIIRENLKLGLSETSFPIAYAMLTGNSDYMDVDVLNSYRQAGVAHVFAVSGLHIGFIAGVLGYLLHKLNTKRWLRAVIITLTLLFYSGVCGFSASSLRATIMASVMAFAAIKGNKYDGLSSTSLAATLILLFEPVQLFCLGFQLSFVVVIGILVSGNAFSRLFEKLFKFLPEKATKTLGTVFAAQLYGSAICLQTLGSVSLIAVLVNLIFIPIVSVLFTATLIITLLSAVIGLHSILFFIPDLAFKAVNFFITIFDYKFFIISGIVLGGFIIFYYLAIIIASGFINLKRMMKICLSIGFSLVFVFGTLFYNITLNNRAYLVVGGDNGTCFTFVESPENNVMIISDVSGYFNKSGLKRFSNYHRVKNIDALVISGGCSADTVWLVTQLRTIFDLENIYYYGEKNDLFEEAFDRAFGDYKLYNYTDEYGLSFGKSINISTSLDGRVINVFKDNVVITVFSPIDFIGANMPSVIINPDYAIFSDNGQLLKNIVKPKNAIFYNGDGDSEMWQRAGNLTILLK